MLLFFIFSFSAVEAAKLDILSSAKEIGVGRQFQVDVFLNTESEELNAVSGDLVFPDNLLEFQEIRSGNSIINFWIEQPAISEDDKITFAGIVPGGYSEPKGYLFSVIFLAKNAGNGKLTISKSQVLKNDGQGTPAAVKISDFYLTIASQSKTVVPELTEIKDTDPPENFEPVISQNSEMFDGKYFLVFATQDKGTGVDGYFVSESRHINEPAKIKSWQLAASPYVLQDQKLRSYIYVKAVDKAGNEKIAYLPPLKVLPWYENYLFYVILVIAIILLYIIWQFLWRTKKTKQNQTKY